MGKIVAIDYGNRRIGLAIGDRVTGVAMPWQVLPARGDVTADAASTWSQLSSSGEKIDRLIVGLPLNMNGSEGPQARASRRFGKALAEVSRIELEFHDERLSTFEAEQRYVAPQTRQTNRTKPPRKRKRPMDAVAASVILERYLQQTDQEGS